jgi:hypothetical protein
MYHYCSEYGKIDTKSLESFHKIESILNVQVVDIDGLPEKLHN